jgi:hypothetical protein
MGLTNGMSLVRTGVGSQSLWRGRFGSCLLAVAMVLTLPSISPAQRRSVKKGSPSYPPSAWPFGPPLSQVEIEGILVWSDGRLASVQLDEQQFIRFQLSSTPSYQIGAPDALSSFQVADHVRVQAEVDGSGCGHHPMRFAE